MKSKKYKVAFKRKKQIGDQSTLSNIQKKQQAVNSDQQNFQILELSDIKHEINVFDVF